MIDPFPECEHGEITLQSGGPSGLIPTDVDGSVSGPQFYPEGNWEEWVRYMVEAPATCKGAWISKGKRNVSPPAAVNYESL